LAFFDAANLDLFLGAKNRLFKGQGHLLLDVGAPLGLPGPAPGHVSKKGVKDIAEAPENIVPVKGPIKAAISAHTRVAKAVILGPLFGVMEHLVGFIYLFELIFRIGVFIAVRVIFHGLLSESLADILI
jgi:hypothetical protein